MDKLDSYDYFPIFWSFDVVLHSAVYEKTALHRKINTFVYALILIVQFTNDLFRLVSLKIINI